VEKKLIRNKQEKPTAGDKLSLQQDNNKAYTYHLCNKIKMISHIKIIETILYVSDQDASCRFYQNIFRQEADLHVPGMTEFNLSANCKIGLMPNQGIAGILSGKTPHPDSGQGIPRCELYLYIDDIQYEFENAIKHGAKLISPITDRDWGDRVCYFADPDGHIIAFAEKIK
jgi:predicted enzyme related to lactoylglutathione lyase